MKKNMVNIVKQKKLFNSSETIIVALSGGVDSMVLFDIIHYINRNIVIAHVNHNKREESIKEYEYLKEFAKTHNLPFEGYTIEKELKDNFHNESRKLRYKFFRGIAQKYKSNKIAVAHHLDDQVETILMRIVRGTSFSGYSGIKETRSDRNLSIIRPLMDFAKKDILEYATNYNIKYFEDSSNIEDIYTRNRFRNNIIPLLKAENPNLDKKIVQFSEYIEGADIVLEELKDAFLKEYCMYSTVSLAAFNKLNMVVKIKVLQHLVNLASQDSVEVSFDQYKKMIEICFSETSNQQYSLSKNFEFRKEYEVIFVEKLEEVKPINIKILKVGEYFVSDTKSYVISTHKLEHNNSNYYELCYNKLVFPLYIRNRQNGDKIRLKIGTKKVKDILIDQKIPPSKRDRLLVLANDDEVLWIPGIKKGYQEQIDEKKLYVYEVE
ncbi:tRNA lysidine(34) synthetase TilS [Candidatus Izimaplasma bacterium]|nr:tRNA lysidine(34) synthetase TilS [Candidatus Izimaplasma bacterium]